MFCKPVLFILSEVSFACCFQDNSPGPNVKGTTNVKFAQSSVPESS